MTSFCMISDTHNKFWCGSLREMPSCDVLIHAGDMTMGGSHKEILEHADWLESLKSKYEVIFQVPGNHDLFTEDAPYPARMIFENRGIKYLVNEGFEWEGFKIWGSPITPWFYDWAWNVHRGKPIAQVWAKIPMDTNILITHGPPHGILDKLPPPSGRVGCEELVKVVKAMPDLKMHVFGHIHPGYGILYTKKTVFVNASSLDDNYSPVNQPIIVDLE